MKICTKNHRAKGLVTISVVVALSLLLFAIMVASFKRALVSQEIERTVQLQVDYGQREDALIRGIVSQVPQAVAGMMQDGSGSNSGNLRWRTVFENASIFADSAASGNTSSDGLFAAINQPNAINVNVGEQAISDYRTVVSCVGDDRPDTAGSAYVNNRARRGIDSLGNRLPPKLEYRDGNMPNNLANNFPTLSPRLYYGSDWGALLPTELNAATLNVFDEFTSIPYPEIHFGYAKPGDYFIAKHNWWAFDVNLAAPQAGVTGVAQVAKPYCLSLYEVPSQLAITAAGFSKIGEFSDGTAWGGDIQFRRRNSSGADVEGGSGIYGENVEVKGGSYERLAARRGLSLNGGGAKEADGTAIDGDYYTDLDGRERYEVDQAGKLLPISLSGNSGRVSFVPVDVGLAFYDLFFGNVTAGSETNIQGDWKWSEYSRGAGRCDMRLVVTEVEAENNQRPTEIAFSYRSSDENWNDNIEVVYYTKIPTDVNTSASPPVNPWPDEGTTEGDAFPFHPRSFSSDVPETGLEVNVERIPQFLIDNGIDIEDNRSLVVNPDYVDDANNVSQPTYDNDSQEMVDGSMVVIMNEAEDLTGFEFGFSLVTNLRLYIDSNVNEVSRTAPANSSYTGTYFPPVSIFAPEVRYGTRISDRDLIFDGRLGKMKGGADDGSRVGVVELRQGSGATATGRISATLRPIQHPAEVPPITMMNWMIVAQPVSD